MQRKLNRKAAWRSVWEDWSFLLLLLMLRVLKRSWNKTRLLENPSTTPFEEVATGVSTSKMLFQKGSLFATFTLLLVQALSAQALAFDYGNTKIRGVSLGGWLLLEPFLTPSIFLATNDQTVVDEYTYGQKYGSAGAAARLKNHW